MFLNCLQGAVGIHIVGDPGYAALHHWIQQYVRDLPQHPHVFEMTNADPWRMHLVSPAILLDDLYLQLTVQQQVSALCLEAYLALKCQPKRSWSYLQNGRHQHSAPSICTVLLQSSKQ